MFNNDTSDEICNEPKQTTPLYSKFVTVITNNLLVIAETKRITFLSTGTRVYL